MFRFQSSAPKAPQHSHYEAQHTNLLTRLSHRNEQIDQTKIKKHAAHIFLGEVYQVLQIDVISVGPNVVVNEEIELVLDPVFEDEGQDSSSQLQEEDDTQEHGELQWKKERKKTRSVL